MTDIPLDPFTDYSKISKDMVEDMYAAVREQREAQQQMIDSPSPEAVERLLKSLENINDTIQAIEVSLVTIPATVHLPGPPEEELSEIDNEDSSEIVVQRCVRCKSPLMGWRPGLMQMTPEGPREFTRDDVEWHDQSKPLAKVVLRGGSMSMYQIDPEDRELEPHERECVQMPELNL